MQRKKLFYLLGLIFVFTLSGCVVRTYQMTKDRVDQDLTIGNRGYIKGIAPAEGERKATRSTQVVEIELHSPIRFERAPKAGPQETIAKETVPMEKTEDESLEGNRGYISQSSIPEISEPAKGAAFEKYTVQKRDTLQKISNKFYGTTKKWNKIYQANLGILKSPNSIYPGQVINIPIEGLKETEKKLK